MSLTSNCIYMVTCILEIEFPSSYMTLVVGGRLSPYSNIIIETRTYAIDQILVFPHFARTLPTTLDQYVIIDDQREENAILYSFTGIHAATPL